MKRCLISVCIGLFCLTGCTSTKLDVKELKQLELKLSNKQKEIDKKTRIYVTGAIEALSKTKLEQPEELLALSLLSNAQQLIGAPLEAEKLSIGELIMSPIKVDMLAVEDKALLEDRAKIELEKKEAELKVLNEAQNIVNERDKGFLTRIKDNIVDYANIIMLTIIVAGVLFAFPLLIKLCFRK
jgi:hypothetical protein